MARTTFRKTDAGLAEVKERRSGIDARLRTLLILCNGRLAEAELAARMAGDVHEALQRLLALGLVAAVRAELEPAAPVVSVASPAPPAPQPAADPASAAPPLADERRRMLLRARAVMEEFYGPGGGADELRSLSQAQDAAALDAAFDRLRTRFEAHQGRKRAALLVRQIRGT